MTDVRHIGITIAAPFAEAYGFAQNPESFREWAAGMATTLHREGDRWIAGTPEGEATVLFSPPNDFGILDHRVRLTGKPEIVIPLRMIAHGNATEVVLTLFRQPDMDDAAFERDAATVTKDLATLKTRLEQR